MNRVLAVLALLTLPLLAACGDDGNGRDPGDPAVIEVQDAGAAPRVSFALDLEEGHRETSVMVVSSTIDAGQVVEAPPIELTFTNEVTRVDGDEVEVLTTYDKARVTDADNPAAAQVEQALAGIDGVTLTSTFAPSGALLDSDLELPDGLDPTVRQTLEQVGDQASSLAVAFPEDDLGVGATWTAETSLEVNGVEVEQTTSYKILSLDGDDYEIEATIEQDYVPGKVQGAQLESGNGTTRGRISGTVGNLSATRSTASGTSRITVSAEGQEQTVTTATKVTVRTTVE